MKILISYGGMLEKIDGVRSITNTSSGATGVVIANYFANHGADVVALKGKQALECQSNICTETFSCFDDLDLLLRDALTSTSFDAVIHLAAVSDYTVNQITIGSDCYSPGSLEKIDSGDDPVTLSLKKTPKLISRIKEYQSDLTLIGFKLTNSTDGAVRHQAVNKLMRSCDLDFVVHNDLSEISKSLHRTTIYDSDGVLKQSETKEQLAIELYQIIEEKLS